MIKRIIRYQLNHIKLKRKLKNGFKSYDSAITAYKKLSTEFAKYPKSTKQHYLINLILFISVAYYDISMLAYCLRFSKIRWQRNLLSRITALTIEELIEDIRQLSGNKLRECINDLIQDPDLAIELNSVMKSLSKILTKNVDILKDIRNFTIAHRDKDALYQLEIIERIEPHDFENLLAELIDWFTIYLNLLARIMQRLVNVINFLTQIQPSQNG